VLRPTVSYGRGRPRSNGAGVSPRQLASIAATAVLAGFGGVAGPAGAAAAASYDVPARAVAGALVGPSVTVATRGFPAGARFVAATVSARHAPGSSGRATMLSVTLTCGAESVQATTNVVGTAVLTPRRVMRDATGCTVVARSAVDHATAGDALRVTATLGATSIAGGVVGYTPEGFPTLLRPGQRRDVTPVTYEVPAGTRSIAVAGDVKVTTCTSVGGSRENGSPYLCAAARVKRAGTRLRVSLVAQQKSTRGGYCAVKTVATHTVHVGRTVHHAMIGQRGSFVLSTARGCARAVRVKIYTQVLSGADVVIHRRGTITSVYR
jgi:hypothetical protein